MAAFPGVFGAPHRAPEPRRLWRSLVGDVLRSERRAQRRILTEVAGVAGVSPQYLSEIERGRKEPSSEVLAAVAGALGLDLGDVVVRVAGLLVSADRAASARRVVIDLRSASEPASAEMTFRSGAVNSSVQPTLLAA